MLLYRTRADQLADKLGDPVGAERLGDDRGRLRQPIADAILLTPAGDDHADQVWVKRAQVAQQRGAAHAWHTQVSKEQIVLARSEVFQRIFTARGRGDVMPAVP